MIVVHDAGEEVGRPCCVGSLRREEVEESGVLACVRLIAGLSAALGERGDRSVGRIQHDATVLEVDG